MTGYAVAAARDGVEALRQLETHISDVVVLDIPLPRVSGDDVQ